MIREKFELILVDDGSTDGSFEIIEKLAKHDSRVTGIKLSRNFGHQNAVTCGLHRAKGSAVVIIDSDLQDPPRVIVDLVEKWNLGYKNVYAVRELRKGETRFKRLSAKVYYRFINLLSDHKIPNDTGDFRLIDRQLLDTFMNMKEENRYLRGMIAWLGFPSTGVTYQREPRAQGKTSYSLGKMLRLASNGIISFSGKPLKISTYLGVLGICLSSFYSLYVLVEKIIHPSASAPGYSTIVILISTLASLELLSIGILGEYLYRIYTEVKGRPLYVVEAVTKNAELPYE